MPTFLRHHPNANQPIVPAGAAPVDLCYFNLLRLREGEEARVHEPGFETVFVVLGGRADIQVGGQRWGRVGGRADVWSGPADSVYAGTGAEVVVTARVARPRSRWSAGGPNSRLRPSGSSPKRSRWSRSARPRPTRAGASSTSSARTRSAGRATSSSASCAPIPGCWSGYPPHKHDEERPPPRDRLSGGLPLPLPARDRLRRAALVPVRKGWRGHPRRARHPPRRHVRLRSGLPPDRDLARARGVRLHHHRRAAPALVAAAIRSPARLPARCHPGSGGDAGQVSVSSVPCRRMCMDRAVYCLYVQDDSCSSTGGDALPG